MMLSTLSSVTLIEPLGLLHFFQDFFRGAMYFEASVSMLIGFFSLVFLVRLQT